MALERIPGLIDIHTHLREPGAEHKEDFRTGSRAAIAGGFTFIIDMPNNPIPTISMARLGDKIKLAKEKAICDIGFHFGTTGNNEDEFREVYNRAEVFGLKVYCNNTTGLMMIGDRSLIEKVFFAWKSEKPILVHAEGPLLATALLFGEKYKRRVHVCHISTAFEVGLVREAKKKGQRVTAGVTPHHLYLNQDAVTKMRGFARMKPILGIQEDQDALWRGLQDGTIDIIETDHAPHTKEEKEEFPTLFGVPGLETALGLMYVAVKEGRIQKDDVVKLLYTRPKEIFNIPDQPDTYVELDPDLAYVVPEKGFETKCDWSPFSGMTLYGKPQTVVLRGKKLLENGKIVV